jgi:hypothetical protein
LRSTAKTIESFTASGTNRKLKYPTKPMTSRLAIFNTINS